MVDAISNSPSFYHHLLPTNQVTPLVKSCNYLSGIAIIGSIPIALMILHSC